MNQTAPFEVGVALLDQPEYPLASGGIAVSRNGQRRFSSFNDLETAITWSTNVPFQPFRESGMFRRPNARNDQLMRMGQAQILHEIGMAHDSAPDQANALHQVIEQTLLFTDRHVTPCPTPFQRLDWHFTPTIRAMSRETFGGDVSSLTQAARSAHTYVSASAANATRFPQMRTYCAPRLPRFAEILNLPAPSPTAAWRWVRHHEKMGSKRLWEVAGPIALVEISVSNPDELVAQVAPFGVGARKGVPLRLWAPLPEAMWYADHGDLEVMSIWKCDEAVRVRDCIRPGVTVDWDRDFSFSAAIVSEAFLYTLMGTSTAPAQANGREALGAYVAAYDRLQMIQLAIRIAKAGYSPISASCGGRVVVGVSAHSIQEVDDLCERLGLEPPMTGF